MSKFVQLFKAEISRLARHEVKVMTAATRKAASASRSEIAALKREVTKLRRELGAVRKAAGKAARATGQDVKLIPTTRTRSWTSSRIAGQRRRLGLTQAEFGKLCGGKSGVTVLNWEKGSSSPRAAAQARLNEVAKLGRREARAQLG